MCVSVCTLISPLRCSNSELWKGQTVTFLCDSGLKWDMMWAARSGLHARSYTQLRAHARLGRHCGFDPCFLTLHHSEKSKLKSSLFCSSAALRSSFPPTPLPLTLARGHPPVDGTIPAAFDIEFALQPTAISWFCNKSKRKMPSFYWVYCTAVTSSDCKERSRLKRHFKDIKADVEKNTKYLISHQWRSRLWEIKKKCGWFVGGFRVLTTPDISKLMVCCNSKKNTVIYTSA